MKQTTLRTTLIAAAIAGATALGIGTVAYAQQGGYGPGFGMGPAMMGTYGAGMAGGHGRGFAMGTTITTGQVDQMVRYCNTVRPRMIPPTGPTLNRHVPATPPGPPHGANQGQ